VAPTTIEAPAVTMAEAAARIRDELQHTYYDPGGGRGVTWCSEYLGAPLAGTYEPATNSWLIHFDSGAVGGPYGDPKQYRLYLTTLAVELVDGEARGECV
jgi:hypothetical protein